MKFKGHVCKERKTIWRPTPSSHDVQRRRPLHSLYYIDGKTTNGIIINPFCCYMIKPSTSSVMRWSTITAVFTPYPPSLSKFFQLLILDSLRDKTICFIVDRSSIVVADSHSSLSSRLSRTLSNGRIPSHSNTFFRRA